MTTPLPDIDIEAVAAFWNRCRAAGCVPGTTELPDDVGPFGDSAEMADELIALVLEGTKRATAGSAADYEADGRSLPEVGDMEIVTGGDGRPRAVVVVTEVRVGPLDSVDDAFAWDEGEGDRTRVAWLTEHVAFFERYLPTIGVEFSPQMPTVFQRFEVVYSEPR